MARDTGAQCKQCRREGQKLFLKGERCLTDKCGVERRSYAPGEHGRRRVDIPSYQVRPGDVVAIKADTPATQVVRDATELTGQIPAWLQADHESLTAKVLRKPERREVAAPVQEQLIVELYSK